MGSVLLSLALALALPFLLTSSQVFNSSRLPYHQNPSFLGLAPASPLIFTTTTITITSLIRPYDPQFHPEDVELLPLVAKRLVEKRVALGAVAAAQAVVEPQPEGPAVPAADAQELGLAEHAVVVSARVREGLEADALRRRYRGRGASVGYRVEWVEGQVRMRGGGRAVRGCRCVRGRVG